MGKVAFALLWCFVLFIPCEEYVQLEQLGSLPRVVGLAASVVGVLYVLARGSLRPLSWFHVLAAAFVLWAGASSIWSIDPEATRQRVSTYVQLAVLVWLIWELAWSPERQRALLQAYVLGAGIGAIGIIRNVLSGVSFGTDGRFTTLNANPNELALTLALGLPITWYLAVGERHRRFAWLWQLYLPLGMTGVLLTASRGGFGAALVALLIIPWTLGQRPLRTKALVCAVAVGSIALGSFLVPEASLERIRSSAADMQSGYYGGRGIIWQSGLAIAWEHPLAGVGAGAFGPAVALARSAHQTFLAILVEDGVVGLGLFLFMVAALMASLRHLPPLQRKSSIILLAVLGVGSLTIAWDYDKALWYVLGFLAVQAAVRPARHAVLTATPEALHEVVSQR
jgi:O-antigen ligase